MSNHTQKLEYMEYKHIGDRKLGVENLYHPERYILNSNDLLANLECDEL